MDGKVILIVEDEADLRELLVYNVEREGYTCRAVSDGAAAIAEVRRRRPDLMILDRMLPRVSGDQVVSQLKADTNTASIPVLMVTAKGEESDQLVGFALGADDYITKPFSMKVLLARIAAMFRRVETGRENGSDLTAGPIALDPNRYSVHVGGRSVHLTSTEFRLLQALMAARGRVLDRDRLIDAALGETAVVTDRTIDVHIAALRKKLGDAAGWIQTIRGVGYTLRRPS